MKHRFLHYHPEKATKIINACTILHNMCISNNILLPTEENQVEIDMGIYQQNIHNDIQHQGNDLLQGRQFRATVINYIHRNRQI